jgi:hypothetical protein
MSVSAEPAVAPGVDASDRAAPAHDADRALEPGGAAPPLLPPSTLLLVLRFPFIVWGADEARRYMIRRRVASGLVEPS